jgi:hypothetical protein
MHGCILAYMVYGLMLEQFDNIYRDIKDEKNERIAFARAGFIMHFFVFHVAIYGFYKLKYGPNELVEQIPEGKDKQEQLA